MALYRNLKTGAVIDSPYNLTGDNWILESEFKEDKKEVKEKKVVKETKKEPEKKESKIADKKVDEVTKAEIIQELDAFGIEYNKNMTKKELIELLK